MLSDEKYSEYYQKAKHWHEQHQSFINIEERLIKDGADNLEAQEIVKQIKLLHYAVKRKRGSFVILTGSLLLFIGFVMTISNFYANSSFAFVMYGFTSVGLLVIFIGLYDSFG